MASTTHVPQFTAAGAAPDAAYPAAMPPGIDRQDIDVLAMADEPASFPEGGAVTLDGQGVIQDCDERFERQFGYSRSQVQGHHLSMLLPELADIELLLNGHMNEKLHFLCHIGKRFLALHRSGARFASRLFLTVIGNDDMPQLRMLVRGHS